MFRGADSIVALGDRDGRPVVLKRITPAGDAPFVREVIDAFGGRGMVRALEVRDDGVLLERVMPGTPLADANISDDEATTIIADLIGRMSPGPAPRGAASTLGVDYSQSLHRRPPRSVPAALIDAARATWTRLSGSQSDVRLLHGDLHHRNVLLDSERGWIAIDPKGVTGELAFEVGAALRNPCERPDVFADPATIRRRADCFARVLHLDPQRVLAWAFAQAVLAALWEIEDDGRLTAGVGWIAFAQSIQAMPDVQLS